MKKSLLASALITMLISATAFVGDVQAAPHRGGHRGGAPNQSTQVQKQRPPQSRPHKAPQMKPQRTGAERPAQVKQRPQTTRPAQVKQRPEARPMPTQAQPAKRPTTTVKPQQRPDSRPDMRPDHKPNGRPDMRPNGNHPSRGNGIDKGAPNGRPDMRPDHKPNGRPDMKPNSNQPPRGNGIDKGAPNGRPDMRPNGNQPPRGNGIDKGAPNGRPDMRPDHKPNGRPDMKPNGNQPPRGNGIDKGAPNGRPDMRPDHKPNGRPDMRPDHRPPHGGDGMRPDHRPPHGGDMRPPHNRPPHYRPPIHRSHYHPLYHHHYHGLYHWYYGIFIPPIIYGGCYYDTIYDNDAIIEKFVYIQPSKHTNIFLTPLLRENGHPDDAVFCVTYDGQEAYEYDLRHGDGAFYRIAIKNEPKARKWKADPPTNPNPPYITSVDDFLYKYHFTPSPTALFDGKHLYKFDADNRSFVENQTIEGLTTTYKHGDIYLIHATPDSTHPYPKYYLILPDAIYETTADASIGYIDFNELNHDTKKLWKIIK